MSNDKQDYYVYALAYPDELVFYIGKGKGNRIDQHEMEARKGKQSLKCETIRKIWAQGQSVLKYKVRENLSEQRAFALEGFLLNNRFYLTNIIGVGMGHLSLEEWRKQTIERANRSDQSFVKHSYPEEEREARLKEFQEATLRRIARIERRQFHIDAVMEAANRFEEDNAR